MVATQHILTLYFHTMRILTYTSLTKEHNKTQEKKGKITMKTTNLFKRLFTTALAAVMAVSTMSMTALATDNSNNAIYTYTDENNNIINITQADLDAEHWDKNELGSNVPFIYKDFPMYINSFVDDYSNMSFDLTYLKNLDAADSVYLTITDLSEDCVVYDEPLDRHTVSIPDIEIDTTYQLTISETFDGVTAEYNKAVVTSIETPELPGYITDNETEDETIILVGDVDDLRASVVVNEDGSEEIVEGMPRYEQVKACSFKDYISNLAEDKLYRIYTHSSDDKIYVGFISTSGDIDGIFMPTITIYKWDTYLSTISRPRKAHGIGNTISSTSSTPAKKLTSSEILNSTVIDINRYRDYEILYSSADKSFQAYRFLVPDEDDNDFPYDLSIHANDSVTVEIWTQQPNATSLTYETLYWNSNGNIGLTTLMQFAHGEIHTGGYVYFAVYFNGYVSSGEGILSIQRKYTGDDVTGSAYEAYQNFLNGNYTQYTTWTPFYITDDRDVDTFFLTYGTSSKKNYIKVKPVLEENRSSYNDMYTHYGKHIEFSYTPANQTTFYTSYAPSDVITMPATSTGVSYTKTSTTANKRFVSIYNVINGSEDIMRDSDIYLFRRYNS